MKVIVNRDLCVGHGLCEAVDPGLFEVGEDGIAHVLCDDPADRAEAARTAVATCPSHALRIEP
ncbi:ferredoxin [Nocardia yunnanensis]|uniref:Ferredoxin n=1 Tax=Nocardia yunnanensis TaxID=2382165 RepID=A0A386ZD02_9NOCA|nr:ferredoxin [Nocardia yunnanensis]AYF75470.1 ferredoxin [Nocardia yunnanensis]